MPVAYPGLSLSLAAPRRIEAPNLRPDRILGVERRASLISIKSANPVALTMFERRSGPT